MKEIHLLNSRKKALVDDTDYALVSKYRWAYTKMDGGTYGYATAMNAPTWLLMHHLVLGSPPKGLVIDHRDRNGLNNLRNNLRLIPAWLNSLNRSQESKNYSGFTGVVWNKGKRLWEAQIQIDTHIYLGSFDSKEDAIARRAEVYALVWSMWEKGESKEEIRHAIRNKYVLKHSGGLRRTNKTGVQGVQYLRPGTWKSLDGKTHIGYYSTFEDAVKAREDFITIKQSGEKVEEILKDTRVPRPRKPGVTGYTGVYFDKFSNKYRAEVRIEGKQHRIGSFSTIEEAIEARSQYLSQHHLDPTP